MCFVFVLEIFLITLFDHIEGKMTGKKTTLVRKVRICNISYHHFIMNLNCDRCLFNAKGHRLMLRQ